MHHHRLRSAGDEIVPVRHRNGSVLMRHQHRLGNGRAVFGCGEEGFDDGGEVGAGVQEQPVDTMRGQPGEEGFGRDARTLGARFDVMDARGVGGVGQATLLCLSRSIFRRLSTSY